MSAWVRAEGWRRGRAVQVRKALGLDEPAAGVLGGGGAQRPGGGPGAHRRELVPQPELAQQPQVRVPGQAFQAAVQPQPGIRASCLSAAGRAPQLTSRSRR